MELSIGLVLMFVTLVTSTPHGYGVKGGASAKAEASAVAGGFGDIGPIPLSIPSGAAYSGSFSKSSSSSFASSSASASSSSYSFSGSGASGLAHTSGLGQKGCSTGSCSGIGANGPAVNGAQPFGTANTVATAQAKALSGAFTPCQGSQCNSHSEKCSSGLCPTDSAKENQTKCSTGNCQSNSETESPSTETALSVDCASGKCEKGKQESDINDSNDFAVNINRDTQGKSSQGLNDQYYNKQGSSESSCYNGKCGAENSYPNYGTNKQKQQPVPATYLTTPNHNEPCTTPDCKSSQDYNPETSSLPTSYNVPIQSATNPPDTPFSPSGSSYGPSKENKNKNVGSCVSGRCDINSDVKPSNSFAVSGINSPSYSHGGNPSGVPLGYVGKTDCNTPNCGDTFSYQPSQGSSSEPKYTYPAYTSSPVNKQENNCIGTDCSGLSHSGSPTKPNTLDTYSGGFGGPAGILDTGVNKFPVHPADQFGPTHTSGFTRPTGPTIEHGSFGTTKPNELSTNSHYSSYGYTGTNGYSGTTRPFINPSGSAQTLSSARPTVGYLKPNSFSPTSSTQFNPTFVNSFGTPATSNTPLGTVLQSTNNNEHGDSNTAYTSGSNTRLNAESSSIHGLFDATNPGTVSNTEKKPTYTGGYNRPTGTINGPNPTFVSTGAYKPGNTNCGTAGCNGYSNNNCGTSGCNGQPGYVDTTYPVKTNPNTPTNSQTKPVYTGGFSGPTGSIDGSSPTFGATGGYKPSLEHCGSAGCSGQNDNIDSSLYDTSKPNTLSSSQTTPMYTGGFGGPTGTVDGSSQTFGTAGTYKPSFTNCGSKSCNGQPNSNSNVVSTSHVMNKPEAPHSSPTNPLYTDSFGGATGTLDGSSHALGSTPAHKPDSSICGGNACSGQPTTNDNFGSKPYDKPNPSTPNASQSKPIYTGGFGGPSGLLRPNDFSLPSTSLANVPCTTGTCAPKGAPSLNHNQGNSLTGAQSLAAATASANAIAYTGGFGGPPGVLKAYDNGKISGSLHGNSGINSPNLNSQNLGLPSANSKHNFSANSAESGNELNSAANAIASATASAVSNAGNNINQSNTGKSGGCNSGCPNNGSHGDGANFAAPNASSSASARSIAGANSFGFGGSFASSSASAHASAGAATKGGYGRK